MSAYPFRPDYTELKTRIAADLAAMPNVLREPLAVSWARTAHGIHGHLEWIDKQCSPLTCDLERLYDWANLYQVERLDATAANGMATVSGASMAQVLAGTRARGQSNGLDYVVQAAISLKQTTSVVLKCSQSGTAGNLPAGEILRWIEPIAGCDDSLTVGQKGLSGGDEEEDLEAWRARVVEEWQTITTMGARSGKDADYRFWAKSAHPSVSAVLVQRHALGLGTVLLRPICNGLADRLPTQGVLDAIANKLATTAPATADWRVAAPIKRAVEAHLHLLPGYDSQATRNAVEAAIQAAVLAESGETSVLAMAELDAAMASVTTQYQRSAPNADIVVAAGEVLVLSRIVWS